MQAGPTIVKMAEAGRPWRAPQRARILRRCNFNIGNVDFNCQKVVIQVHGSFFLVFRLTTKRLLIQFLLWLELCF